MNAKFMITNIGTETWFRGTRDEREVPTFTVIDRDRSWNEQVLKQSLNLRIRQEDLEKLHPIQLLDQTVIVSIEKITSSKDLLIISGALDFRSVPESAKKNGDQQPQPQQASKTEPKRAALTTPAKTV